jgi:phosphoribosylformimino-5-aminoimidazole carboxamide ribotide isomerase
VGGGVRTGDHIERLLDWGAARVVVGTRALTDVAWLNEQARRFPDRLVVAADIRAGRLATRGWTEALDDDVATLLRRLGDLPLAGVLVTAVDVEGQMRGPALEVIERAVSACPLPITASGGVGNASDLRALEQRGAAAAVIGMALYTGTLDARAIAREFAA